MSICEVKYLRNPLSPDGWKDLENKRQTFIQIRDIICMCLTNYGLNRR